MPSYLVILIGGTDSHIFCYKRGEKNEGRQQTLTAFSNHPILLSSGQLANLQA